MSEFDQLKSNDQAIQSALDLADDCDFQKPLTSNHEVNLQEDQSSNLDCETAFLEYFLNRSRAIATAAIDEEESDCSIESAIELAADTIRLLAEVAEKELESLVVEEVELSENQKRWLVAITFKYKEQAKVCKIIAVEVDTSKIVAISCAIIQE